MAVFLKAHLQKWETSARFTIDCSRPISVWARWCVDSYVNLYGEHDGSVFKCTLAKVENVSSIWQSYRVIMGAYALNIGLWTNPKGGPRGIFLKILLFPNRFETLSTWSRKFASAVFGRIGHPAGSIIGWFGVICKFFRIFFNFFESTQMWFGIIPEVLRGRFGPNRRSCRGAILGDNMQIFSKISFFRIRLKSGLALSRKCSEAVFGRIGDPAGVQYWVIICKFFPNQLQSGYALFCRCSKAGFCLIGVNAWNANKHDQLISDWCELTFYTFASELVCVNSCYSTPVLLLP